MKALLDELDQIVAEARSRGIPIAVIGACALRVYLPDPDRRVSNDADLLTSSKAMPLLTSILQARGYRLYSLGPWWRAERDAPARMLIDIAIDEIVDVRTFTKYSIEWSALVERAEAGRTSLPVPPLEDLIAQKLIAAREKDLLDVVMLAMMPIEVNAERLRAAVEAQDVEIPVMRGCLEASAAVASGGMAALWLERYGEEVSATALEAAVKKMRAWVENGS